MPRKPITTEEFIVKVKKKFPFKKWTFEITKYVNEKTPVKIYCHELDEDGNEHGIFEIRPDRLLRGHKNAHGCRKCWLQSITRTTEQFIADIKRLFPYKDWSFEKTKYIDQNTDVIITCHEIGRDGKEHGDFVIKPCSLYRKTNVYGCRKCYLESITITTEEFVKRVKDKYPQKKWSFEKTWFINWITPVTITCHEIDKDGKEHGDFSVRPDTIIYRDACGCEKCFLESLTKTTEEFIAEYYAKFHNKNISFEKFEYKGCYEKSVATCHDRYPNGKEHGDFPISPLMLLHGVGCPSCNKSRMEEQTSSVLNKFDIVFVYRCRRDKLPWLGYLELDFYLPAYNIAIECQGEQHYRPIKHFGGETKFKKTVECDQRKARLCEENGVRLFYIRYDENVEEVLTNILTEAGITAMINNS